MKPRIPVLLAGLVLLAVACGKAPEYRLEGRTMGTTWHVAVVGRGGLDSLQEKIDRRLEERR